MPDYSKGKIYKIYNDSIPDKVYYGSTINTLVKRLGQHKDKFHLCTSKQLFPNAKIVLVEKFPCNDKDELTKRERYYIENNECVNKNIPGRTIKEWKKVNKENIKQIDKKYRENNNTKEKIGCRVCKSMVSKTNFDRHCKSKNHQSNLGRQGV